MVDVRLALILSLFLAAPTAFPAVLCSIRRAHLSLSLRPFRTLLLDVEGGHKPSRALVDDFCHVSEQSLQAFKVQSVKSLQYLRGQVGAFGLRCS